MRYFFLIVFIVIQTVELYAQNTLPASGNVGINTTSPYAPLHVVGGSVITAGWNKTTILEATYPILLMNSANHKWGGIGYDHSTAMRFWVNSSSEDLPLHGRNSLTILNNGYVGVGTGNPNGQLHVNSEVSSALMVSRYGGNTYGFEIAGATFGLYDYTNSKYKWKIDDDNLLLNPASGKVGIGTTTPSYLLHLNGLDPVIQLSSTASQPYAAIRGNGDSWLFGYNGLADYEDISIGTQDGTGYRTITLATGGNAKMKILANGNIGIGTLNPGEKLSVNGNIRAKKILVSQTGWPDYVFDSSYSLRSLVEVENFITKNKHLPDMPSAKEVEEKGISIGDNQALMLKKIEELTLYILQLEKRIKQIESVHIQTKLE